MIYDFECNACGHQHEVTCSLRERETYADITACPRCAVTGQLRQVFVQAPRGFLRSPFPKGFFEHVSKDGAFARDKSELKDIAEANGQVSHYVENGT